MSGLESDLHSDPGLETLSKSLNLLSLSFFIPRMGIIIYTCGCSDVLSILSLGCCEDCCYSLLVCVCVCISILA